MLENKQNYYFNEKGLTSHELEWADWSGKNKQTTIMYCFVIFSFIIIERASETNYILSSVILKKEHFVSVCESNGDQMLWSILTKCYFQAFGHTSSVDFVNGLEPFQMGGH